MKKNKDRMPIVKADKSEQFIRESNAKRLTSEELTRLEKECKEVFGTMRDATDEETQGTADYVDSISQPTGISFFDEI